MDDVRAGVQKVAAGDAAWVLVSGMWSIAVESRGGDSEVFAVFDVGEGLDVRGDEGRVYVHQVIGGCGMANVACNNHNMKKAYIESVVHKVYIAEMT